MKFVYLFISLTICSLLLSYEKAAAQIDCEDFAVLINATVDTITPTITLNWDINPIANSYTIYRKTKTETTWNVYKSGLSSTTQQYVDTNVVIDSVYEYLVQRGMDTTWVPSEGYIYVSVKLHPAEYRGTVILVIDSTYRDSFSTELTRLKFDLIGDGWTVIPHEVSPNDSVDIIRNLIKTDYHADPKNVTAVFLFGHVPVPYSGDINPDGHPNHLGAWPADGIYGDMNDVFTDDVNFDVPVVVGGDTIYVDQQNLDEGDTVPVIAANMNIAGDGKYDQSYFTPGNVVLEVGRVDLNNMDSFALSEPALLKQYLNKDHGFRQKQFTATRYSIISDNFGVFDFSGDIEAFASCGWRNFAPLLGSNNVIGAGYFSSLNPQSCLWSYGCGGGDFTGAGGIGSTPNFAHDSVNTVFTMLFGSYFGDWNVQNNFLRAPLASQPMALSCCWGGRPQWNFHFMGSGETLGFSARWAQNNTGESYYAGYGANFVHIALMGDPTLTMNIVAPAANPGIKLIDSNKMVQLHWSPSPDTLRGYYIYRATTLDTQYTRIAIVGANDTSYIDSMPIPGKDYYMVRAEKLISSPSGYYFNLSEGVLDSVSNVVSGVPQLSVISNHVSVFPNPASEQLSVISQQLTINKIEVDNVLGQTMLVFIPQLTTPGATLHLDISNLAEGMYLVKITSGSETVTKKLVVSR